jgi:hypothetical protein
MDGASAPGIPVGPGVGRGKGAPGGSPATADTGPEGRGRSGATTPSAPAGERGAPRHPAPGRAEAGRWSRSPCRGSEDPSLAGPGRQWLAPGPGAGVRRSGSGCWRHHRATAGRGGEAPRWRSGRAGCREGRGGRADDDGDQRHRGPEDWTRDREGGQAARRLPPNRRNTLRATSSSRADRPLPSRMRWAWWMNLAQVRKLPWAQLSSTRVMRLSGTPR